MKSPLRLALSIFTICSLLYGFGHEFESRNAILALRFIACTYFLEGAFVRRQQHKEFAAFVYFCFGILLNPLRPFEFEVGTWRLINLMSVAAIALFNDPIQATLIRRLDFIYKSLSSPPTPETITRRQAAAKEVAAAGKGIIFLLGWGAVYFFAAAVLFMILAYALHGLLRF